MRSEQDRHARNRAAGKGDDGQQHGPAGGQQQIAQYVPERELDHAMPPAIAAAAGNEQAAQADAHAEIDESHDKIGLEGAESSRLQHIRLIGEFAHGNLRDNCRFQHHDDNLAGQRRENDFQRLRQHDLDEDLPRPQTQRRGSLPLSFRHGIEPGTNDLGGIGGHIQRHRQHGGDDRIKPNAKPREPEEDEEELHQKWRVADDLDIGRDRLARERIAAAPRSRPEDAEDDAERRW